MDKLPKAATLGQEVQTTAQSSSAVLGLLAAGLLVSHRPIRFLLVWTGAIAVGLTGGVAPIVWGGAAWWVGLGADAGGLLVAEVAAS